MTDWPLSAVVPFFAHQGGWDEIALVAGPLLLIALALWVANRRVSANIQADDELDSLRGRAAQSRQPDD